MSKTRGILPQTVLVNLLHKIVMSTVGPWLDRASEQRKVSHCILGGSKGSQPQDVSFAALQVLEKGRDRHDEGSVAQADILQFHDRVPWGYSLKAMLDRGIPAAWARATLRIHRAPRVIMKLGGAKTRILERSCGVLTGAKSAGLVARLSVEDSFVAALPQIIPLGFQISRDYTLVGMAWSDNLFSFAATIANACKILAIWAAILFDLCGLYIKDGSCSVIKACPRLYEDYSFDMLGFKWQCCATMRLLGHWLSATGSCSEDRRRLRRSWEASFWRNSRVLTNSTLSLRPRLRFWAMLSQGIGQFRFSMWAPVSSTAALVEGWHNRILYRIVRLPCREGESRASYTMRRNRTVALERIQTKLSIRAQWAACLVRWLEHVYRHTEAPSALLLGIQDDQWLQTIRCLNRRGTGTRSQGGFPIRWAEKWVVHLAENKGLTNPAKDKTLTWARAELVEELMEQGHRDSNTWKFWLSRLVG